MGFSERLRELRRKRNLSQSELADMMNVSFNAIANYENGQNYPKFPSLINMMDALQCDANYIFQDYLTVANAFEMSEEERGIIEKYRKLNSHGQKAVRVILEAEYECAEEWIENTTLKKIDMYLPILKSKGFVLSSIPKKIKIVPDGINGQADFCLKLRTNMAKPMFQMGDVLLLKRQRVVNNGIGLFDLNGYIHIKKLYRNNGRTMLMPFNPSEKPLVVQPSDRFETLGQFIGKLERNYIET